MIAPRNRLYENVVRIVAHSTRSGLASAVCIAVGMAVFWWLIVVLIIKPSGVVPVWFDQAQDFTQVSHHLSDPYDVPRFVYVPWTAVFLIPFGAFSLSLAVLLQLMLYFVSLTFVIFRYGGNTRIVIMALTSFIALDNAIELNIEWITCLGLLVPAAFSGPFLLTKPQVALGVWMSYSPRKLITAGMVMVMVLLVSFIIWPAWPDGMRQAVERYTLTEEYISNFNMAPLDLLPMPFSPLIGVAIAWHAIRRRDPVLSILAWFFFVPYIPVYTLLFYLAILAIRLPKLAWIIQITMWVIYGGAILLVLILGYT